jgi:hypothetical protein
VQRIHEQESVIEDYAPEGPAKEIWSPYYVTQPGDPAKLDEVLLAISDMESPPQLFVTGSDALSMITPAAEARLRAIRAHKDLSMSTDGTF